MPETSMFSPEPPPLAPLPPVLITTPSNDDSPMNDAPTANMPATPLDPSPTSTTGRPSSATPSARAGSLVPVGGGSSPTLSHAPVLTRQQRKTNRPGSSTSLATTTSCSSTAGSASAAPAITAASSAGMPSGFSGFSHPPHRGRSTFLETGYQPHHNDGEHAAPLNVYTLYETRTRYYILATNSSLPNRTRVLKIDRTSAEDLNVVEDTAVYDAQQIQELLRMIEEGNKGIGGLVKVTNFFGIVGFIKFTQGWYMILIMKRSAVGLVGGHYIYHVDKTHMQAIGKGPYERSSEETKLVSLFQKVDLSKNFYFSYTYDLTSTLQANLVGIRQDRTNDEGISSTDPNDFHKVEDRYMWNYHLLREAFHLDEQRGKSWKGSLGGSGDSGKGGWILPLIFGFVDQIRINLLGRIVYITVIGRRSRFFAGARYLKRGSDAMGHVANEVETEQIVVEPLTTPFHSPAPRFASYDDPTPDLKYPNPNFTSYVQYRGSIPLFWTNDVTVSGYKPPIEITNIDPYFAAAARHFDELLEKYGAPLIVLNLIKAKENTPRESKLLGEFTECIDYLNQFLPEEKKMIYLPFDMSGSKRNGKDVIGILEDIASEATLRTGFFHSGRVQRESDGEVYRQSLRLQEGVIRTNCVDCLDRTNAAQFAIAKAVLGHQLHALGILATPEIEYECDAVNLLTEIYHDHGDTIALQYSGGALVNRIDTYQRTAQWNSHSRDMIENFKRYYANNLLDFDKQLAINLFLGIDKELKASAKCLVKRSYQDWFDPRHLEPVMDLEEAERRLRLTISQAADYVTEYYRPRLYTTLDRHFAFKINSTSKYLARFHASADPSPFVPRRPRPGAVSHDASPAPRWPRSDSPTLSQSSTRSIRSSPPSSPRIQPMLTSAATEEEQTLPTKALDPNSIEYKLQKSMAPEVTDQEVEEYIRWSASHEDELFSSHTLGQSVDYELYQNTVISDTTLVDARTEELVDEKAYGHYLSWHDAETMLKNATTMQRPAAGGATVAGAATTGVGAAAQGTGSGRPFGGEGGWVFGGGGGGDGREQRAFAAKAGV